ncbi:MAG: cytochrome b/b6 domain-containing protein [Coriobacteriia bacterium]|nr:cytochrome b/b6 domain-containing protein [Coriobacteriia bacterium]
MSLTEINVWLDTVFSALYLLVLLFLVWHFSMFVIKGRFRKSFIEGKWPEHDSRPPATPKVLHAVHMVSMIILGFTGMYIRFPFTYGGRTFMTNVHYLFMIIVIAVLIWRLWYAFYSKTNADWREFAIGKKDLATAGGVLKYYGYLSDQKPHVAKYNVMQKMSYSLFLVMMVMQAITGLLIWRYQFPIIDGSFYSLTASLAGATGIWVTRMLHYVLNWGFIIMTTVHFYLAFSVDVPCALDFFGLKELEVVEGAHGHGDEGDAHGDDHGAFEPVAEPSI